VCTLTGGRPLPKQTMGVDSLGIPVGTVIVSEKVTTVTRGVSVEEVKAGISLFEDIVEKSELFTIKQRKIRPKIAQEIIRRNSKFSNLKLSVFENVYTKKIRIDSRFNFRQFETDKREGKTICRNFNSQFP
jgi:hypothetical protein